MCRQLQMLLGQKGSRKQIDTPNFIINPPFFECMSPLNFAQYRDIMRNY